MTVHPPPTRLGDMELPRFKPDAILRLKQSALYLARKTAPYAANLSTRPLLSDADGPFLPLPSPLAPQLTSLGVDEVSAHRISLSLTRAASKLKGLCEEEFKRRLATPSPHFNDCQAFARIPSALSAIYARAIREWTSYLLTNVAPRVLHIQSLRRHTAPSDPDNKVPFNHNATPALEAFFDENAFPSRLEKHELAVRWGMRYRQIDVWFQNRRRRFKKEGKDLKQRPSGNALLHDLEQVVVDTLLPLASEDEGVPSEQERNGQSFSDIPAFNLEVPAHAFPNPWPPVCPYDPFPIVPGERTLETPWPRLPSPAPLHVRNIDVEDVVHMLAKLTLAEPHVDAAGCTVPPKMRDSKHLPSLFYVGFITPCLRAPLPALINRPRRASRARRSSACALITQVHPKADRSQPTRTSRSSCAFTSTRQPSILSELDDPSLQMTAAVACPHRTKRSLPRRLPKNPPVGCGIRDAPTPTRSGTVVSSRASSTCSWSSLATSPSSEADSPLSTPKVPYMALVDPLVLDADDRLTGHRYTWSPLDTLSSDCTLMDVSIKLPPNIHDISSLGYPPSIATSST